MLLPQVGNACKGIRLQVVLVPARESRLLTKTEARSKRFDPLKAERSKGMAGIAEKRLIGRHSQAAGGMAGAILEFLSVVAAVGC